MSQDRGRYRLNIDKTGQPKAEKLDEPAPSSEIQPAEDGKYYLLHTVHTAYLAIKLAREGVETYCAKCKAPLQVLGPSVECSRNPNHFSGLMHISDSHEF